MTTPKFLYKKTNLLPNVLMTLVILLACEKEQKLNPSRISDNEVDTWKSFLIFELFESEGVPDLTNQ